MPLRRIALNDNASFIITLSIVSFFLLTSIFFRQLHSELTEQNSTKYLGNEKW